MKTFALCGHEIEEIDEFRVQKYCDSCLASLNKYNNNPRFHRLVSVLTRTINCKDFTLDEINEAVSFLNGHKNFIHLM